MVRVPQYRFWRDEQYSVTVWRRCTNSVHGYFEDFVRNAIHMTSGRRRTGETSYWGLNQKRFRCGVCSLGFRTEAMTVTPIQEPESAASKSTPSHGMHLP